MYLKRLAVLFSIACTWATGVAPALANEFLYEVQPKTKLVPVGTNFLAEQSGSIKFVTTAATIECERSSLGGTLTANKNTAPEETPKAEVQAVVYSKCKETGGLKAKVIVRTKTNPVWKLDWTAGKTLTLTAVSASVELQGLGITCTLKNKAGSNFNMTWKNAALSEIEFSEQLLTVEGGGTCPTEAKVTGKYKLSNGYVADGTESMFLE